MWLESRAERFVFGLLALGLIFSFSLLSNAKNTPVCQETYRKDIVIKANGQSIDGQLARSPQELEQGLSGKNCIGEQQGMLFKFDQSGYYSFWMKDMKFNIDILWIDSTRKVVHIEKDVSPATYPNKNFTNSSPASDVLELKAGRSDELGLKTGSQLYY